MLKQESLSSHPKFGYILGDNLVIYMMHSLEISIDGSETLSHHIYVPIQQVFENHECEPNPYIL